MATVIPNLSTIRGMTKGERRLAQGRGLTPVCCEGWQNI